jgi:sulfite reductase beta subunit-like hemoprotein
VTASRAAERRPLATFADAAEITSFAETLARFERGEIEAEAWRAYRVARGAYGQRQDGVHMLRVKVPQGAASSSQLRALAAVARRVSDGALHITTRQNVQLYFVRPADLEPAMRQLAEAGLTTSGSGGNTVRNVVACPYAGVAEDELFDVTPYAEAFTRHFLRHPLGQSLPRKFKVAFEGCREDHVGTAIQDLGFRARLRGEGPTSARGFAVTVAGGTSTLCTSGLLLLEFLPAGEILAVGEAVVRVFHVHGDRVNRQRNRLKFLVRSLGFEAFRELVLGELERTRNEGTPRLPFDPERPSDGEVSESPRGQAPVPPLVAPKPGVAPVAGPGRPSPSAGAASRPGGTFESLAATNVRPQRQPGYSTATISLPQGNATGAQLEVVAWLAKAFGDGAVRFTGAGHLLMRWIRNGDLPALQARLASAGLGRDGAGSAADVLACPGADVCRLAVTETREPARLIEDEVRRTLATPGLEARFPVRMSGCPNGCSQHHVAAIGLQGSIRRADGEPTPHYLVLLGGYVHEGGAVFGQTAAKIPASLAPAVVARLASLYLEGRLDGEGAGAYLARDFDRARQAITEQCQAGAAASEVDHSEQRGEGAA